MSGMQKPFVISKTINSDQSSEAQSLILTINAVLNPEGNFGKKSCFVDIL